MQKKNNKDVIAWGSGKVYRDLLYVDDLARAIIKIYFLPRKKYEKLTKGVNFILNVGSGKEISIKELTKKIKTVTAFKGKIKFDITKPDGMKKKMLSNNRINKIKWFPKINFLTGLKKNL